MNPELTQAIAQHEWDSDALRCRCGWDERKSGDHNAHLATVVEAHVHPEVQTVEELDALPVDTIIRDDSGHGARKQYSLYFDRPMWFCTGWKGPQNVDLPAHVLFRPVTS